MMDDYKRESIHGTNDFGEYEFNSEEGVFECLYVGRWMNKDNNLMCCFDFDDGRKIRAMAWENTEYYNLDKIVLGVRLRLEYKKSSSGKNYLRKVTVL